jgi:2-keto-myo-inositol isomerase
VHPRPISFALNCACAPHLPLADFLVRAQKMGVHAVELRNDIEGHEFANGMQAAELRARLDDAGLKLASVNALQSFNDWTPTRADEARRLK